MAKRHFHLRLQASYQGDENAIDQLMVEVKKESGWEELDLNIRSPGFLLFINGLFSCQHLYMRVNSAERGILLESSRGELIVIAGNTWNIEDARVSFEARVRSGTPTEDAHDYITERMMHCPVSTNIDGSIQVKNSVQFIQ